MSSDDDVVGRVKGKARDLVEGLLGRDESVADEDPDIEYDPPPKQRIMHDGMVVLSEEQAAQVGTDQARDAATGQDATGQDATGQDATGVDGRGGS